jgi:hypothetical protein
MQRVAAAYRAGRIVYGIRKRAHTYVTGALLLAKPRSTDHSIRLRAPAPVAPDPADRPLVQRIYQAFRKMKRAQRSAPARYQPSLMWEDILRRAYCEEDCSIERFHQFLANFGASREEMGIESSDLIQSAALSMLRRRFYEQLFLEGLARWRRVSERPVSALTYPTYGNQAGAYLDDTFVGLGSFDSELLGRSLKELIESYRRPAIVELGAGYGKLAYFTLRDLKEFAYIDLDLPETLSVAAYFLIKTFPAKRALLFGEEQFGPHTIDSYEFVFMPPWEIEALPDHSIDLFLNKNSLGEMRASAVRNYIEHISRITHWFVHLNHEHHRYAWGDDEPGLLASEYPVPQTFNLKMKLKEVDTLLGEAHGDIFRYDFCRSSEE